MHSWLSTPQSSTPQTTNAHVSGCIRLKYHLQSLVGAKKEEKEKEPAPVFHNLAATSTAEKFRPENAWTGNHRAETENDEGGTAHKSHVIGKR